MIIKLQYGEDTRRVSQPDNFTYEQLLNVVSEKFGLKDFHLRYPDEDGDLITISSELDMAEARRLGNSATGLKVVVQPGLLASQLRALVPSPKPSSSSPPPSPPPVEQKPPAQPAGPDITGLMGDLLAQSGITPNLLSSLSKCKSAQELRELIPQLSGVPALQQLATYLTSPAMATSLQALLPLVVNLVSQVTTGPLTQSTIVPPVKSDPMVPASLLEMFGINMSTNPAPVSAPVPSPVKAPGPSPVPSPVPFSSSPSSVSPVAAPPAKVLSVLERLESIMPPASSPSPITIPSAPAISPAPSPVLGQPATPTASPIATLPVASPVASQQPQQPVPDTLLRSVGPFNPLNARFVTDLSVPDGTLLEPNQPFVKTWRFQNVGSVMWPVGTRLECIAGNSMGGQAVVVDAAPGEIVEISVPLIAPPAPGRFCGYWRLHAPDGLLFGHRVWVDVFVRAGAPAPSPAPVVPAPAPPAPVPVAEPLAPLPPSVPLDKKTQEDQDLKIALALAELELSEQREDERKRKEEAARKRAEEQQREQQRRDEDRRRKEEEGRSLEQRRKEQQAAGLATIKAMGFDNEDLIAQMLAKHNGDVALALNELINLLG